MTIKINKIFNVSSITFMLFLTGIILLIPAFAFIIAVPYIPDGVNTIYGEIAFFTFLVGFILAFMFGIFSIRY